MKINRYIFVITILSVLPLIGYAQEAPVLQTPENEATGLSTSITFQWSEVSNADTYQIEVAETANFENPIFQENTSATSIEFSGFTRGETYYWRVRSGEILLTIVEYSDWSSVWSFTTAPPPPDVPVLISPENNSENLSTEPLLQWNSSEYAESYRIQVSETEDFSTTVEDQSGLNTTEIQITALKNSTTYHWRVNASNESGNSDWSEAWSFTTVTNPPAPPNLVSPENNAMNISTTVTLEWEPVENADTYDFQIALDENFNNKIVDQTNVTSTVYQGDFEGYTNHYWRVRAGNDGGESNWSDVWNFTTEPGEEVISIITPGKNEIVNGSSNYTIKWQSPNRVNQVNLDYSVHPNSDWTTIEAEIDASSGTYSWEVPDTSSVSARIKITDSENSDINSVSQPFILYPTNLNLQHQYSFSSTGTTSDYRLIGLPAEPGIPVEQMISGDPGSDWNIYFDNGNAEDYLVPYDSSEVFTFSPGKAFWAVSRSDIKISENVASVELSSDTTYSIDLHEGWNIISNPFGRDIPWTDVQLKNDIEDPIWSFDRSYSESESLEVYQGYYFYNRNNLEELVIPFNSDSINTTTPKDKGLEESNFLTLKLLNNSKPVSEVDVGVKSSLSENQNLKFDYAPPGDFQNYKIAIQSEGLTPGDLHLARLARPHSAKSYSFDLFIKSPSDQILEIQAEGLENFSSYDVVLVDPLTSKTYDLHQNTHLRMNSHQELKNYTLVIGNKNSREGMINSEKPQKTALFQNYPNPFNNQTMIEYSINENMDNSHVQLDIYNVIGQRVAQLVNERQSSGFYQVSWNAENNPGHELASGLYFYRLQVGSNTVKTRQLTLLK